MLIQFKVRNFCSFKNEAILDMRAVNAYKEHSYNLIDNDGNYPLQKVSVIYGANASGKSNLLNAYYFFTKIVMESFQTKTKATQSSTLEEYYTPFLFDSKSSKADTEIEAIFYATDAVYQYGFTYNASEITHEWLYKRLHTTGRQTVILERDSSRISIGSSVRKYCEKYLHDIDNNVLALSFFSSLKLETSVFSSVLSHILDILVVSFAFESTIDLGHKLLFTEEFSQTDKTELLRFLKAIDSDIQDISVKINDDKYSIHTYHKSDSEKLVKVPLDIESDGTLKAIALYFYIRTATKYGKGLMIDELNSRLHPLLQKYLIDMFYSSKSSGQLIYTTHDMTLLSTRYMRRDQIWFVDKNETGESSLYSLAEFKPRKDKSIGNEYLAGAFGGVPDLADFAFEENENGD